jgi:hypothetical protein
VVERVLGPHPPSPSPKFGLIITHKWGK